MGKDSWRGQEGGHWEMGREGERKQMIRITTIITRIITADAANFKDLQEFTHEILKLIYLFVQGPPKMWFRFQSLSSLYHIFYGHLEHII